MKSEGNIENAIEEAIVAPQLSYGVLILLLCIRIVDTVTCTDVVHGTAFSPRYNVALNLDSIWSCCQPDQEPLYLTVVLQTI